VMAPLIQVKAGKCQRRENTNFVDPINKRGLLYLENDDDGLLHFYFKDLENDIVQDDYILSGGDATFTLVPSTQRVYVLKFTSDNSRHFFWMQNVDGSNDETDAARINSLIGGDEDVEMS